MKENDVFPRNLQTYMGAYGISQTELAKRCGISQQSISKWKHGTSEPKNEMIEKLCEIFTCSRHQLCDILQTPESMVKGKYFKRLMERIDRLNIEGLIRVTDYVDSLNEKYFEEQK